MTNAVSRSLEQRGGAQTTWQRFPLMHRRRFSAAAALLIAAWFLSQSWRGFFVYFTTDDVMNMYWACETSMRRLVVSNLVPFTTAYRPLGAAVYRILYETFGLHPVPFHVLFYALLLSNIYLCYQLARNLTNFNEHNGQVRPVRASSGEIAILAAFLGSFHHRLSGLYINNGTIYDVLCGTFYLGTLSYYIRVRERGGDIQGWQWAAFYALNVAALNAKETATTIPLMLICYEVLFQRAGLLTAFRNRRALVRRVAGIALSIALTALMVRSRFQPGSRLIHNDGYALRFSVSQFLTTSGRFFDDLFYLPDGASTPFVTGLIVLGLVLLAVVCKSRAIRFCVLFVLIAPLPVNFIPARDLYAAYIPVFGWAVLVATALVGTRDWAYTRLWHRPALDGGTVEPERVFLVMVLAAFLLMTHSKDRAIPWEENEYSRSSLNRFHAELLKVQPAVARSSTLLFLDDAFEKDNWTPVMLCRLTYHDLTLSVDRPKMGMAPPPRWTKPSPSILTFLTFRTGT